MMDEIKEAIQSMANNNFYAYLALTSKLESPIRDKVAFYLNNMEGYRNKVGREYSVRFDEREYPIRFDIGIEEIRNERKELDIVEFAAWYSFDLIGRTLPKKIKVKICEDFCRYENLENRPNNNFFCVSNFFYVIVACHPEERIQDRYIDIIAYATGINNMYNNNENSQVNLDNALTNMRQLYPDQDPNGERSGSISLGTDFGIPVKMIYAIFSKEQIQEIYNG